MSHGGNDKMDPSIQTYVAGSSWEVAEADESPTLDARTKDGPRRNQGGVMIAATLEGHRGKAGGGISPEETLIPTIANPLEASDGHHGYSSPRGDGADNLVTAYSLHPDAIGRTGDAETPSPDAEGRVRLRPPGLGIIEDESYTLNATSPPGVGSHAGVRRLTPVECERLQGFPDGWTDVGGTKDGKRYAALGDAVTVPVAEWIGRRIMEHVKARSAA